MSTAQPTMSVHPEAEGEPEAASDPGRQLAAELGRLRERLTAYERLDGQLEAMIAQLTDLLRGSVELRRRTHQEITAALTRCEALINADREAHQRLLETFRADLAVLRQRASATSATAALLQTQLEELAFQLDANGHVPAPATPPPAQPVAQPTVQPTAQPAPPTVQPAAQRAQPAAQTPPPMTAHSQLVVIQNVPSVAVALTLQQFLGSLEPVTAMAAREYAAGELRLEVETRRPLTAADLQGWPGGRLALVELSLDRIVLRYAPDSPVTPPDTRRP